MNYQTQQHYQITHDQFMETICSIDEIADIHRYKRGKGMKQIRDKFKPVSKYKLQSRINPISSWQASRNQAIILINIILSGKMSILDQFPLMKYKACKILSIFKKACKLIQNLFNYSEKFKKCVDPKAVFFSELYLKYCSFKTKPVKNWTIETECSQYASHMNFKKCCQLLKIHEQWNQLRNHSQVRKQIGLAEKTNGFFSIKEYFQERNMKTKNQYFIKVQQKMKSFKLFLSIFSPYKLNLKVQQTFMVYLFKQQNGVYVYQKCDSNLQKIAFESKDQNEYLIFIIFDKIIGMDAVLTYKNRKLTPITMKLIQNWTEQTQTLLRDEQNENTENLPKNQKLIKS